MFHLKKKVDTNFKNTFHKIQITQNKSQNFRKYHRKYFMATKKQGVTHEILEKIGGGEGEINKKQEFFEEKIGNFHAIKQEKQDFFFVKNKKKTTYFQIKKEKKIAYFPAIKRLGKVKLNMKQETVKLKISILQSSTLWKILDSNLWHVYWLNHSDFSRIFFSLFLSKNFANVGQD